MITVEVIGSDIETALRRLKKKVGSSGLKKEMRAHQYFMSKSEKRRLKVENGKRKAREREERRLEDDDGR